MVKLRELRDQRGLTREQLAAAAEVSFSTVVRLESGSKPHIDVAVKIARFFGIPVESIEWGAKPSDDEAGKDLAAEVA